MNFKEEYSEAFDELRKNRVKTSFYKYGSAKENFGKGYVDALGSLEGNTEYLLDAGNYAMFEYMYPQHEKAHFRATDSSESAGIVGLSVGEARRIRDEIS